MAEDIKVKDYGAFPEAVKSINDLNKEVSDNKTIIEESITKIDNDTVFAGPICNSMKDGFSNLTQSVSLIAADFSDIGKKLTVISQNYNKADAKANKDIFEIKEGGTTVLKTSANQALVDSLQDEIGNRMKDYAGSGFHKEAWCADWVSLKLKENGYAYTGSALAASGSDGNTPDSITGVMEKEGAKVHYEKGASVHGIDADTSYTPQPGDVCVINVDGDKDGIYTPGHVGFVKHDNGDGTVTTIEGNTFTNTPDDYDGGVVAEHIRDKDKIYSYATPEK